MPTKSLTKCGNMMDPRATNGIMPGTQRGHFRTHRMQKLGFASHLPSPAGLRQSPQT